VTADRPRSTAWSSPISPARLARRLSHAPGFEVDGIEVRVRLDFGAGLWRRAAGIQTQGIER